MKMTPRCITTGLSPEEQEARQRQLHELNLDRLAWHIAKDKIPRWAIFGVDESGVNLMPRDGVVWADKGAKSVTVKLKASDYRQYTIDMAVAADGSLIAVHFVFTGSSERSLPSRTVREAYPDGVYHCTRNHWANHETKVAYVVAVYKKVVEKYMATYSWSREYAHKHAASILFLDCWPVNLTQRFRAEIKERCPGLILIYVPAGATSFFQVHDTHLHGPLKTYLRQLARAWYMGKVNKYTALYKSGKISLEQYRDKVAGLMSMPKLRERAPEWVFKACAMIGLGVMKKAWDDVYFNRISAPGFLEAATARHQLRIDAFAAVQSAAAAAAAALAAAGGEVAAGGGWAGAGDSAAGAGAGAAVAAAVVVPDIDAALVASVAAAEEAFHTSQVPKLKRKTAATAKPRGGRGRVSKAGAMAAAVAAAEAEESGDEAGAAATKPKRARKKIAAAAPAAADAAASAPAPVKAAGGRKRKARAAAESEEEEEEDEDDEEGEGEEDDEDEGALGEPAR